MSIYMRVKLRRRWMQIKKKLQSGDDKYKIFQGSYQNYLRNGAWVLEESIALFHGRSNPIRNVSVTDLNSMQIEGLPFQNYTFYHSCKGSWEGRAVLVKTLVSPNWRQIEAFLREIVVAAQMTTHNNAHKLLGCCLETKSPVLVYEWIEMETLQDCIDRNKTFVLEWKDRLRIAWEISHAVAYLHTAFPRPIIHRTLTPRSVFLDQSGAAKLSDFSLCVSIPEGEEFVEEDDVVGTVGYLAPECFKSHKVAECIDVYSFGVLFMTLLTGKRPLFYTQTGDQGQVEHLPTWVQNSIKDNCIINVVDPVLTGNGISAIEGHQLRASIQLALWCIAEEGDHRPSMVEVATMLKDMIRYPESIFDCSNFKEKGIFRIFSGNKENFVRNEKLVIQESISLFYGKVNPLRYFSVDDLNSMNVGFSVFSAHKHFNWYQGSWEGIDVLLKLPKILIEDSSSSDEILLMYVREIVVSTQMATHDYVHKIIGCCLETATPVLVYEWLPCQTLKDHIYSKTPPPLEWKDRLRTAREISHVVSYLHSAFPLPIVHRFLNPESIFLDENRTTKIYNFTHSVSIPEGENFVVQNLIDWTEDYTEPEVYKQRKVAKWTDVYSFGILFLELLSKKQAKSKNLIDWITEDIEKDDISLIIDPDIIRSGASITELRASMELAIRCIVTKEDNRPTMEDIATELDIIIRSSDFFTSV